MEWLLSACLFAFAAAVESAMIERRRTWVLRLCGVALLACLCAAPLFAQDVTALIRDAAYNEAQAHQQSSGWSYRVEKEADGQTLTEEQVDTAQGPVYRLLAVNGRPPTSEQREKDTRRVNNLLANPRLQKKASKEHADDERQLVKLLRQLPDAFVFQVKARNQTDETIAFSPNPNLHDDGYEARIMQAIRGELVINLREKRIVRFGGSLFKQVNFGYGLLGKINQGGTFDIVRTEVAPGLWKTTAIQINVSGRFSFFATITKHEDERRSDFRRIPDNLTAAQGYKLIDTMF